MLTNDMMMIENEFGVAGEVFNVLVDAMTFGEEEKIDLHSLYIQLKRVCDFVEENGLDVKVNVKHDDYTDNYYLF